MVARIFKPAKTAMQSGPSLGQDWVLEFEPATVGEIDPLMGYTGASETASQVHLTFETREAAVAYAERNGLMYRVTEPQARQPIRKTYADNFKFGRVGSWTH